MEHMNKKFPKGNNLLREHKETTLEKNQRQRIERRIKIAEYFNKTVKDRF